MQTLYFDGIYNSIRQMFFFRQDINFIWNEGNQYLSRELQRLEPPF